MAGGLKSAIVILTNHKITIKSDPKVLGILPSTSQLIDHGSPKISEYKIDQGAPKIAWNLFVEMLPSWPSIFCRWLSDHSCRGSYSAVAKV